MTLIVINKFKCYRQEKETEELKSKQEEEARAKKEQEEKEQQAKIQEEQQVAAENARIQEQQRQVNAQTPNEPAATKPNVATVYITKTGGKYHSHANCGHSKTAHPATLDEALSPNLGPC